MEWVACAGGLRTLYAGIRPTLIRAFPANAAQWLAWELAMRWEPPVSHRSALHVVTLQAAQLLTVSCFEIAETVLPVDRADP